MIALFLSVRHGGESIGSVIGTLLGKPGKLMFLLVSWSGLVLVARTPVAFDNLRAQFSAQTVKKTYLALVEGSVAVGGTLENDLVHTPGLSYCKMTDIARARLTRDVRQPTPLHAVTNFKPIARTTVANEERTLLEVTIYTGVTHQIRAQLALAGMHIVNDRLYGAFAVEHQIGHCLHALAARFRHPVSGDDGPTSSNACPQAVLYRTEGDRLHRRVGGIPASRLRRSRGGSQPDRIVQQRLAVGVLHFQPLPLCGRRHRLGKVTGQETA